MSHASEEIASQPVCWASAGELAGAVADDLPRRGERIAVVGCGTSYNVAKSYAALREASGGGLSDAMAASEVRWGRHYDRFVFVSRSGTTSEVIDAARRVPHGVQRVALVADGRSPLAQSVATSVVLDFAHERSVVQTRFATSVLALLRAHLGEDMRPLVAAGRAAVHVPLDASWLSAQRFVFLGSGWTIGLADEAALKLREGAQLWTESYPAMELRHGPISVLDHDALVWSFGPAPHGLAAEVAATGARFVTSDLDPLADLVRAQRLALALAEARHLDLDHPRHLSFSVVLAH
jgi:fructoselysine-6-P-deglycase FrlB-like protein